MRKRITLSILFCIIFACGAVKAQSPAKEWVPFGPLHFWDSRNFGEGRIAIATEGYLLWSTDDGESFRPQYFPGNPVLRAIEFENDLNGYVAGSNGWIFRTTDGGTSWTQMSSPISSLITDIALYNSNTIVVLDGWGKLHSSTNSGQSWSAIDVPDSLSAPFVLNGPQLLIAGSAGKIYLVNPTTFDFNQIVTPHNSRVTTFDAMGDTLFACAGQSVARSFDLGKSWSISKDLPGGNVQVIKILDGLKVSAFIDGPLRFFSTDMGSSWVSSQLASIQERFAYTIKRFGWKSKDGWAHFIGWFGSVYAIAPNGVDYRVQHQCFPNLPFDKVLLGQVPGSFSEWRGTPRSYGSFFISSDNGWSWLTRADTNVHREALGLYFVDSLAVILPSASGKFWSPAYATSDDGLSWTRMYGTPRDSGQYMQEVVSHDGILELPTYVHVFRSYDSGRTWPDTLHYEDPLPAEVTLRGGIVNASFFGRDTVYLRLVHSSGFAANTFVRTTDGGRSWSPWLSLGSGSYYSMAFASPTRGFIVSDGGLLETSNGGLQWSYRSLGKGQEEFRSIKFNSTGSIGVIAGYAGSLYYTIDSGATWIQDSAQLGGRASKNSFASIAFVNDSTAVIESNSGFFRRSFDLPNPQSKVERSKFEVYFYAFLYPNPVTENRLKVYLHGIHAVSNKLSLGFDIKDAWGRTVVRQSSFGISAGETASTKEIDLGDLSSGVYYLKIS
jgi:photosystem II stability/assembly factor-like uncharacterized protein